MFYALMNTLFPVGSFNLNLILVGFLIDVYKFKDMAWGSAALGQLYLAEDHYTRKHTLELKSSILILKV